MEDNSFVFQTRGGHKQLTLLHDCWPLTVEKREFYSRAAGAHVTRGKINKGDENLSRTLKRAPFKIQICAQGKETQLLRGNDAANCSGKLCKTIIRQYR